MKTRFYLSMLAALLCFTTTYAQLHTKTQEVGVYLSAFEGIQDAYLYYKLQDKGDAFWRFKLQGKGSLASFEKNNKIQKAFSKAAFGYEKRYRLVGKSLLNFGAEAYGSFDWDREKISNTDLSSLRWEFGVGMPIGVIFNPSAKWFVGIESVISLGRSFNAYDELGLHNKSAITEIGFSRYYINFGYRIAGKPKE